MGTLKHGTVYVLDDDRSFCSSITRLLGVLGYDVVAYDSPGQFLAATLCSPACVLLDLQMPGMDGLQVQRELAERGTPISVVFLSAHGDIPASVRAVRNGAEDFLEKPVACNVIVEAIDRALERADQERQRAEDKAEHAQQYGRLTRREREVLGMVARGMRNKQIASMLGTTERTVKAHRCNLMDKLGFRSVAELVVFAEECRLDAEQARAGKAPGEDPLYPLRAVGELAGRT